MFGPQPSHDLGGMGNDAVDEGSWIVSVEPLARYRIQLEYSDGVQGEVDLSHCVGTELFSEWDEPGVFERVRIGDSGEVWWSDRASLCPDSMYLKLTG